MGLPEKLNSDSMMMLVELRYQLLGSDEPTRANQLNPPTAPFTVTPECSGVSTPVTDSGVWSVPNPVLSNRIPLTENTIVPASADRAICKSQKTGRPYGCTRHRGGILLVRKLTTKSSVPDRGQASRSTQSLARTQPPEIWYFWTPGICRCGIRSRGFKKNQVRSGPWPRSDGVVHRSGGWHYWINKGGVGWDVGFEPTTSRTTIWRSTD